MAELGNIPHQPSAVQRCGVFVGRTTNWLYDHIRMIPTYRPVVLADQLANREEFPRVEAWERNAEKITRRIWRRIRPNRAYPPERYRLERLDPRVLHSHFGYVAEGDLALARELGIPWLVGMYGADVYLFRRQSEWLERYGPVFEEASRVLALGPGMAQAIEAMGCPESKIIVHPLGVDVGSLPDAERRKSPQDPLRILFAGTFREKKGIPYLIEAVRQLKEEGVPLEVQLVGESAARPGDIETKREVLSLIETHDLADIIHRHSWLTFHELLQLALRSHVFVAPSVTAGDGDAEGTPFVIQQMMATGMPVVSTQHSDIPFIFGEHSDMLVPERNAGSIADRLRMYAEDPDRITQDGRALKREIRQRFDARDCAQNLAELYASLDRTR